MKQKITIFFMILIICAISANAAIKPNVIVSDFSISQGSAAVGKDFTLSIKLTNTEPDTCAKNIITSIQASFPFIINKIGTAEASDLCTQSTTTIDFPMKIDPTATGGTYQLTISNTYETPTLAQFSSSSTINLFIEGTPDINANIINSNPLDVYAGDTATITVNIENDGSFQAQSMTANIKADTPLNVNWAKTFSPIGTLEPKQSKTAEFTIDIPKDAEAKDYKLYLELQYKDENLTTKIKDFTFAFHIKKKALFETTDGTEILYQNQNSRTVQITLKNTGTDTAHNIKVKLLPQFPFSTDGSIKYVEQLEPGQNTPIQLTIDTDKDATPGKYGLDLLLDFEDAQGKKLQDTATVIFTIQQKPIITAVFTDYWFLWLIAIVILTLTIKKRISKKKTK